MPPLAAIIMRSKNEMPHLQRALEMFQCQSFTDFELFAIDSGSTDGSVELLRNHCDSDHLLEIPPEDYAPGKVLNDAVVRVGHSVIILLNADAVPLSESWLEQLIHPILADTADATFSKQVARPDARFIIDYDYQRAFNPAKIAPTFFSAVGCAFKRGLWEKHQFPEPGYAEDAAWAMECIANGARFQFVEDSVVEHSHNYTLEGLYQKRFRQAVTFDEDPHPGKQGLKCLREIVRDLLHAFAKLKFHTIPYNIAYRITIHRALHKGLNPK